MVKVKLLIRRDCPNCEYVLNNLKSFPEELLQLLEIVDVEKSNIKVDATPAVVTSDGSVDYITGNVYGLIKLFSYLIIESKKEKVVE